MSNGWRRIELPANKTRIKVTHRPASQSFSGKEFHAMLELPDVSVLTGPIGKLTEVGDACHAQLASLQPLSRFPTRQGKVIRGAAIVAGL